MSEFWAKSAQKNYWRTKMATVTDRDGPWWVINLGFSGFTRPSLWYINYPTGLSASYLKKIICIFFLLFDQYKMSTLVKISKNWMFSLFYWTNFLITKTFHHALVMPKKNKTYGKIDFFTKIAVTSDTDDPWWLVNLIYKNMKLSSQRCTRRCLETSASYLKKMFFGHYWGFLPSCTTG